MGDIFDQITAKQDIFDNVAAADAKTLSGHTPGAIVAPEFQTAPDPAKQREVLGISRPGTKIFKTPAERKQAVTEVVDTAKTLGSVAVSPAVQAVAGLAGLTGREGDTSLAGRAETVKKVSEALTYQPQTKSGKQAAGLASYPFDKLAQGAAYLGGKTEEATGSPMAGATVDTLVNALPVLLPFLKKGYTAGKAAIQGSDWYRKATVPERNLVVQSLDDMAAGMKAQGFTDSQVDAKLARLNPSYFQAEVQKRMAPGRPTHDNLTGDTVIPAAESAKIQATAPEVKPVVKGTPQEILALKQGGSNLPSFKLDDTTAYLLDPNALQDIYGVPKAEAIRQAKRDLTAGGDKESALLGYPNRQGLKPEEMADAGVTKQGAVVTDLPQLKQEAEAGNLAWAAEGKPEELQVKAEQVAGAISAPIDSASLNSQASHSVTPEELGKQVSTPENGIAVMKPTKYLIGLDVDGVLNRLGPDRTESVVDPEFVQRLNAALDKYPKDQTGILLTSSQRAGAVMLDDAAIAQEFLKDAGINHDVVGVTPLAEQGTRGGAEIKPWLNAYAKKLGVEKFVALDDRPDLQELGSQHIKIGTPGVEDGQGLAPEHVQQMHAILDRAGSGAGKLELKNYVRDIMGGKEKGPSDGNLSADQSRNLVNPEPLRSAAENGAPATNADLLGREGTEGTASLADKGGYDLSAKSAIQLPEIVEISKELMEGKLPAVAKKLHAEGALGSFYPGKGDIKLRSDIFQTPGLAERVLAHEVGHLGDWLPDKSMAKGNILGRVASLHKYLKQAIEDAPSSGIDVTRAEIDAELRALTQTWKPFDERLNPKFTKYRYSPKELYADAVSVLLNDPALLQQAAPKFAHSFFAYLDRKPEVKRVYEEIQQRLTNPADVQTNRLDQMRGMMDQGNEARQAMNERQRTEGERVIDTAMRTLVDERWAAKKTIETVRKLGNGILADEALRRIEDIPYLSSEVSQVLYDFDRQVLKPIEDAKLDRKDLGVYLFAKRVISEEFKDVVMPDGSIQRVDAVKAASKGHTPETARQLLEELKRDLGDEKYQKLQESAQAFRDFREKVFIPEFERSGYFTPEQIQMMKDRKDYVRFQVQKFFEDDPAGLGGYAAKIHERIGSLEDTANGFIETMLQDFAFLRAVRINSSKQAFAEVLKAGGPEFIQPAELRYSADTQSRVPVPPKNSDLGVYRVKENGKWSYYYVAKDLVEAFDQQPVVATQMQRFWSLASQPFRELFVSKNPAWLLRNIPRDFLRTVQNVDDAKLRHIPSLAKAYGQTFMDVWRFSHDGERSPQIRQMMADKEIPVKRTWENAEVVGEDEITRLLSNYGLSAEADAKSLMPVRIGKAVWRWLDNTAATSDVWGKVAADKWLREHSQKTDAQRISMVRNRIATPNFKNRGTLNSITNNLFMFSNVGIQGLRSSWQAAKASPGSFMWKAFNLHILPKLILGAAAAGYLGEEYKKILDKVSDYDKRVYHVVPLYVDDKGKARYLRLPDDYEGQWLGAMTWNLLHGDIAASDTGLASTLSAAAPYSWHPLIQVGGALGDYYLRGQNPIDPYTGQPAMTDDEQKAGGKYAARAMGRYAFNKTLSSIYRMTPDRVEPDQSDIEKALRIYPLNALGSFYRISDQGDDERIRAALGKVQSDAAAAKIERDNALRDLIRGNKLTPEQVASIAAHKGNVSEFVQKGLLKKWGMKYTSALLNANGPKEKLAIIQLMQENNPK